MKIFTIVFELVLRLLVALCVVVLYVALGVRLVVTPLFLWIEYNRPGFPVDFYGFSSVERLIYAPSVLRYLTDALPPVFVGDMVLGDVFLFNERELRHLVDVNVMTQVFFTVVGFSMVVLAFLVFVSFFLVTMRSIICSGIRLGSYLTTAAIIAIVVNAVINWDFFFTAFHDLFFADGTWVFEYSDTLIRLFPEQFWFDAAIVIGVIAISLALFVDRILLTLPYWHQDTPD
jgi:integral membrane protein (TIGR01906 family)